MDASIEKLRNDCLARADEIEPLGGPAAQAARELRAYTRLLEGYEGESSYDRINKAGAEDALARAMRAAEDAIAYSGLVDGIIDGFEDAPIEAQWDDGMAFQVRDASGAIVDELSIDRLADAKPLVAKVAPGQAWRIVDVRKVVRSKGGVRCVQSIEDEVKGWRTVGAERMDAYLMESILRASDVLDELAGILRAEGRDALADRLDDAWCAVRDVRCALRDLGPVVVTEAWRCTW